MAVGGVEEDAARSPKLCLDGFNRSNIVFSHSCSRSMFPLADENSMDGPAFCLVTATMETKIFDVAFDYLLNF